MKKTASVAAALSMLTFGGLMIPSTEASARRLHVRLAPVRPVVVVAGKRAPRQVVRHGTVDLNVRPKDAEVWVDGTLRGTVDAFDGRPGKLHLAPGVHVIRMVTPEGQVAVRRVTVVAGGETNVRLDRSDFAAPAVVVVPASATSSAN